MPTFGNYKYLGPGNTTDEGEPINKLDEIARQHDISYENATNLQHIISSDVDHGMQMINNVPNSSSIGEAVLSLTSGGILLAKAGQHHIFDKLGISNPLQYPSNSSLSENQNTMGTEKDNTLQSGGTKRPAESSSKSNEDEAKKGKDNSGKPLRRMRPHFHHYPQDTEFEIIPNEGIEFFGDWKQDEPLTKTFTKKHMVRLPFLQYKTETCPVVEGAVTENQLIAPFLVFTYQWIGYYLTFGEWLFLRKNSNYAKITNCEFTVVINGYQTTFKTNNDTSATVNSDMEIKLDLFRSMEKHWPFEIKEYVNKQWVNLNEKSHGCGYHILAKRLYGYGTYYHGANSLSIGSSGKHVDLPYQPVFSNLSKSNTHVPPQEPTYEPYSKGLTWPAFSSCRWATVDVKTFKNKLFTIRYKPKNGIIGFAPSIKPFHRTPGKSVFNQKLVKFIDNDKTIQIGGDDQDVTNHSLSDFMGSNRLNSAPDYIINTHQAGIDHEKEYLNATIECDHLYNTRTEPQFNSFQSIMAGVRPIKNGSIPQDGGVYAEIRTSITIEYTQDITNTTTINWTTAEETGLAYARANHAWNGLSNDLDICLTNNMFSNPSYGWGGKQPHNYNANVYFDRQVTAHKAAAKTEGEHVKKPPPDPPVFGMGFH